MTPASASPVWRAFTLVLCFVTAFTGCVFRHVDVRPVPLEDQFVASPVKAHLKDGSTVVFPEGVTIGGGMVRGRGMRHDLALSRATPVDTLSLDRVAAMESFRTKENMGASAAATLLAVAATALGTAVLAVAIFGSCPTVYSGDGEGTVLEAETFSHSIAPLLESRDLDRLRARADASGTVRLDVRNEALETHYINHLQLLEVTHAAGALVAPDPDNRPLVVRDARPFDQATDRAGRAVSAALAQADGVTLQADSAALGGRDRRSRGLDRPGGARPREEAAVVLRLKNSLLSTVLFYDVMLASAGPRALTWIGSDLDQISTAVRLGRWVQRRLGMRVSVWRDGAYREVGRVPDAGPIAWRDVAVVVPVPPAEPVLRVRLSFTPDLWRIDRAALGRTDGPAAVRTVPASIVIGSDDRPDPGALASLRGSDGRYLQTSPGQRFTAVFDTGPPPAGSERTFLLSSQGYYTEWVACRMAARRHRRPFHSVRRRAAHGAAPVEGGAELDGERLRAPPHPGPMTALRRAIPSALAVVLAGCYSARPPRSSSPRADHAGSPPPSRPRPGRTSSSS